MLEIQDSQGRTMKVSEFIFDMARGYGWTPGVADEGLARVMEEIRSDDENSIGASQNIPGSIESSYIIDFCRGREWISGEDAFHAWNRDHKPL